MTDLDAPIVGVTVYPDRARVTRRGTARLEPGEQVLAVAGLPLTIDERSVRASGRGANVRLLGVEVTTRSIETTPDIQPDELRARLESVQDEDAGLADELTALDARLAFLKTLRDFSGASLARAFAYGRSTIESVQELAGYLAGEQDSIQARRREVAHARRELAKEVERLESLLSRTRWSHTEERRAVSAVVEATAATELELEVSYIIQGASWEPLYDLRLTDSTLAVTYLANVRQQSGEAWTGVELALSTARPAVSAALPELHPWYVGAPTPPAFAAAPSAPMPRAAGMPPAPARAPEGMLTEMAVAPVPLPPMPVVTAEIDTAGAAVTYRVGRPADVPPDGSPHKLAVTTFDLDAELDYIVVPKLTEAAYLRAKVKNSSPFVLLPGAASIFHGDEFVGTTRLETIAPNEELEVQLGVDDRVKVERELIERSVGKAFIGNTRKMSFGYRITVTNHRSSLARVTVQDQLPVSRHESIKVTARQMSPRPTEHTPLNRLTWTLELEPGESRAISFGFDVEHPRDLTISGIA